MTLLYLGLALWVIGHFFKRIAPGARAGMDSTLGVMPAKAVMGVVLLVATILMVKGFEAAPFVAVYTPPSWGVQVNNTLMLISVFLLGAGRGKGITREKIRHPMLAGIVVWSVAHLLANGDKTGLVLFGGLAIWAIANMFVINAQAGEWKRPTGGTIKGDIKTAVIAIILFGIITAIHGYIGPSPFGGN